MPRAQISLVSMSLAAPNINADPVLFSGHPPPAYVRSELEECITLLANKASPTLKVGIKLPPYTYDAQFDIVINALCTVSPKLGDHPISFLTSTNTLGQGLVFSEQIKEVEGATMAQGVKSDVLALPGGYGGLAGAAVHNISLGSIFPDFLPLTHVLPSLDFQERSSTLHAAQELIRSHTEEHLYNRGWRRRGHSRSGKVQDRGSISCGTFRNLSL
ncbi:hypothetical protein P7C70_g2359, partial [Phenoliferia sp. Uapishka_3]